mmetsp:Transcript_41184/g.54199  ORF Transcript_41184/g.54199 Transcript_41184/m.54199 type:complete len:644 (+) Transcript_41184:338-2269(+)|eukprot:CAMPEP_0117771032 /NCGR_PEP_ID=MMETSP0947-20121206/24205_1 /TAXON_ID=44440 /ORGANISM="Chattonella subsalsa, Strain CCMP2191" /LENGTH=643 /DNA_ID=CAMNT_0005596279 /DNA_START=279 /DNA_END=2210 /DNA_ORIENTATION=-
MNHLNLRAGIDRRNSGPPPPGPGGKKKNTNAELQKIAKNREERRAKAAQQKEYKAREQKRLEDMGCPGDVDFQLMIEEFRGKNKLVRQHRPPGDHKICICVRKRPINDKEVAKRDYDSVTNWNPTVLVHYCKLKVDGITKYLDNAEFEFDHSFGEDDDTFEIYRYTCAPLVPFCVGGGRATVFAYGQTGSGKTYTMQGIQEYATQDLYGELNSSAAGKNLEVLVSFFEIYGGRCQDLLNRRHRLNIREDGKGEVVIGELSEMPCEDAETLLAYIERGNRNRTTHATEKNDVSSRSHAVCQIALRNLQTGKLHGKISLIDLAGSERGADTKSHNRQRRMESAEINKSLLALKECIRALDSDSTHVPYRASKLTLCLKDSFTRNSARTVMIATVAPNASSADHTINTLRYADRVKEKRVGAGGQMPIVQRAGSEAKEAPNGGDARRGGGSGGSQGTKSSSGLRQPSNINKPPNSGRRDRGTNNERGRRRSAAAEKIGYRGVGNRPSSPILTEPKTDPFEDDSGGDIAYLHSTLRDGDLGDEPNHEELMEMHRTVQKVFEEEETLLNLHMTVIQETAELLTEEGRLLQQIQGDEVVDYDIDAYATRLEEILQRKQGLTDKLQRQLARFRNHLQEEERVSKRMQNLA